MLKLVDGLQIGELHLSLNKIVAYIEVQSVFQPFLFHPELLL